MGPPQSDLRLAAIRCVVAARSALGWSQRRLAERAGLSPSFVSRFERGLPQAVTLDATARMFDVLGVRAALHTELPIVDSAPQADAVHAWLCGYVGRRLTSAGFEVRHEVEVGTGRYRGWVDVMGYRSVDRCLMTTEIKSDLPDIGGLQRMTAWYEREAWGVARRFGWRPNGQVVAVLALDSAEVEERIRWNRDLLRAAFPARARDLAAWLDAPGSTPPGRCLALIDPSSRAARWLRASRSDGRRAPNRYVNYADAAGRRPRSRC
jgi:transcriptional regulator with XRE-family HTH domain